MATLNASQGTHRNAYANCELFDRHFEHDGPCLHGPFTYEETEILEHLRTLKQDARAIGKRLGELETRADDDAQAERTGLGLYLEHLQSEWRRWRERHEEAFDLKMRLLGHRI